MANRDAPFAHCDLRVRLKKTTLTLNLTTFKRERKKNTSRDLVMEQHGEVRANGEPSKDIQIWQRWRWVTGGGFSQSSNWCNAMDIHETDEVGLRCTVLPEVRHFRETYSIQADIHTCGMSLPLSPGEPESRKQHDFESCWVLTLPGDARCSCILQLFMFIYNAWPGVQHSSLRVHRLYA